MRSCSGFRFDLGYSTTPTSYCCEFLRCYRGSTKVVASVSVFVILSEEAFWSKVVQLVVIVAYAIHIYSASWDIENQPLH